MPDVKCYGCGHFKSRPTYGIDCGGFHFDMEYHCCFPGREKTLTTGQASGSCQKDCPLHEVSPLDDENSNII